MGTAQIHDRTLDLNFEGFVYINGINKLSWEKLIF